MSSRSSSWSHASSNENDRPEENAAQDPDKPGQTLSSILQDLNSSNTPSGAKALEQLTEIAESGTECDVQTLYEGPRKCECCINWIDTYPTDVKSDLEQEAETKKKALVIRLKKNHSEGRPLSLHSIVVQNQQIKELLGQVFQDYKGITPNLKKLVLRAPFHPFFDRWSVFKGLVEEHKASNHASSPFSQLLYRILHLELQDTMAEIDDLIRNKVITFDLLWALFRLGTRIYSSKRGHDQFYLLRSGTYRYIPPVFVLTASYVDWDGERFGYTPTVLQINAFEGTMKINELDAYPTIYHESEQELAMTLKLRGQAFYDLHGMHYKAYSGVMLTRDRYGFVNQVNSRVVIDAFMAEDLVRPRGLIPLDNLQVSPEIRVDDDVHGRPGDSDFVRRRGVRTLHYQPAEQPVSPLTDEEIGGMQAPASTGNPYRYPSPPGLRTSNPKKLARTDMPIIRNPAVCITDQPSTDPLTDEQLMLCNSHVVGYSLKDKTWGQFAVHGVKEIQWNDDAFPSLILPQGHKDLILAFVEGQLADDQDFDDVIQGKGQGLTILLVGTPGTGKTLTAEAIADRVRRPLYILSAGELGQVPERIEENLRYALELAEEWRAVLLLDECDVFLENRTKSNLNHNEVVAIFLRLLEYYPGMLFLTTNRPNAIDSAFQSRIHLTLNYPGLSREARVKIWTQFCSRVPQSALGSEELAGLSELPLNGRQIKNIIKISAMLARRNGVALELGHVQTVLKATNQESVNVG